MKRLTIFLLLAGALLNATDYPRSTSYFDGGLNGVIAQFVDGGTWQTLVTLINLDTVPATFALSLYKDDGTPMTVQTNVGSGSKFSGTIPVGGSQVITTAGLGPLQQGWGYLTMSSGVSVGGQAIFRQSVPGQPYFEASLPITTYVNASQYIMPFDETTSKTGVAIVNPLSYTPMTVYVTFRDQQGNQLLLDNITLGPLQHVAFSLADRYPQIGGKAGTVQFATTNLSIGLLGLRFEAQSFTSVLPLTTLQ